MVYTTSPENLQATLIYAFISIQLLRRLVIEKQSAYVTLKVYATLPDAMQYTYILMYNAVVQWYQQIVYEVVYWELLDGQDQWRIQDLTLGGVDVNFV